MNSINMDQLQRIRDGSSHSIFGPSGASMWLNCPGSLIPNLLAPDNAGVDAAYGTVFHEVVETWLKEGSRPSHLVGQFRFIEQRAIEWDFPIMIDDEMLDYAEACVDWVDFLPGTRHVERRVDISRITPIPDQGGTADLIVVDGETMYVIDWKGGKGVRVNAENNPQLMLYALGCLWEFDTDRKVKRIVLRIGQPRLDHFDEWVCSVDDLLIFAGWAKARMALAWSVHAPRVAGQKQCEFCRVRPSCAAAAMLNVELTEGVFENLDATHEASPEEMGEFKQRLDDDWDAFVINAVEVGSLSTEQLCKLFPYRGMAEKWWKGLSSELMRRHVQGDNLSEYNFKIVEGRANRSFIDAEKAVDHLESLGVPRNKAQVIETVSPSQAEQLLKKAGHRSKDIPSLLDGLTKKPRGKPTIVPLSDRRDPMADITEGVFDNLESETTETEDY